MTDTQELTATDLVGIYKEIAELIGIEATVILHENFRGQQITLPKKLYTKDYILRQAEGAESIKKIAIKYGYTERRLRQMLMENRS